MKRLVYWLAICLCPSAASAQEGLELRNGLWFNGIAFQARKMYVVDGVLRSAKPAKVDSVIDLQRGYVVPPFGEAHNHNIAQSSRIDGMLARYANEGIFYVLNPNSLPGDRLEGRINKPGTLQAIFANGGLNVTGGHPWDLVQRNIARGTWSADKAEGSFYHTIDSLPDLEKKWARILAAKPDIIKIYLLYSNEHAQRRGADHKGYIGLDPTLVPHIVQRARAAGLRVAAHVENVVDFKVAVDAGVDIIAHMPGYAWLGAGDSTPFMLTRELAEGAAARGVSVISTLGFGDRANDPKRPEGKKRRDALNAFNLTMLKSAGVPVAIGSDNFGATARSEALYLSDLEVFSNAELLRAWSEVTPRLIFPRRQIGRLQDGYEASLIVLDADPLENFENTARIRLRMQQGVWVGGATN